MKCVDNELRGPLAQRCGELYNFNIEQRTRHECQYVVYLYWQLLVTRFVLLGSKQPKLNHDTTASARSCCDLFFFVGECVENDNRQATTNAERRSPCRQQY